MTPARCGENPGKPSLDIKARRDKHADVGESHVESAFRGSEHFLVWRRRMEQARQLVAVRVNTVRDLNSPLATPMRLPAGTVLSEQAWPLVGRSGR